MKKYIFLIIGLICIKLANASFITDDINICGIASIFASNLYLEDESVSSDNIEVID